MIRRPPRSTLFPYNDALPISWIRRSVKPIVSLASLIRPRGAVSTVSLPIGRSTTGSQHGAAGGCDGRRLDRKSTRLNSSHLVISYAVFCLKKKKKLAHRPPEH